MPLGIRHCHEHGAAVMIAVIGVAIASTNAVGSNEQQATHQIRRLLRHIDVGHRFAETGVVIAGAAQRVTHIRRRVDEAGRKLCQVVLTRTQVIVVTYCVTVHVAAAVAAIRRVPDALVTRIPNTVLILVFLARIGVERAVVVVRHHAVAVDVRLTRVANTVAVRVGLVCIRSGCAVVVRFAHAVAVCVVLCRKYANLNPVAPVRQAVAVEVAKREVAGRRNVSTRVVGLLDRQKVKISE
mmetsp:Transcript_2896/g.10332  ORF Transcript_2896/g.10332 Transcript_2896/m.10332 type:complete len:240 (+) Transcript_2896:1498-2217(+)